MRAMKRYVIKDKSGRALMEFDAQDVPDEVIIEKHSTKGKRELESLAYVSFGNGEGPITNSVSMELITSPRTMMGLRETISARAGYEWETINWDEVKLEPEETVEKEAPKEEKPLYSKGKWA